jgi:hypothetical protein
VEVVGDPECVEAGLLRQLGLTDQTLGAVLLTGKEISGGPHAAVTLPAAVGAASVALDRWRRDGEDRVVTEFVIWRLSVGIVVLAPCRVTSIPGRM